VAYNDTITIIRSSPSLAILPDDTYFIIRLEDQYHLVDPRHLRPPQGFPISFLGVTLFGAEDLQPHIG
jgi:hypothetical protein